MTIEATSDRRDEVAIFRYGLIADLSHMEPGEPGTYARLKEKASHSYAIPGSRRTHVAAETMRGWLRDWRKGGFDALRPKPRADQGRARAIPQGVADLLCNIKEETPALSVALVIGRAQATGKVPGEVVLAAATVHRLLSRQGLMAKRPEVLEDLRLLTNYQMDAENRLCLLLVGQAELRRRLSMAAYEALWQRIVVRYHLAGLGRDEIGPYLVHLLRLAGTELPLLEPAAVEAIFQATQGLPRKVNLLAHHALLAAALARAKVVTAEHVQAALAEVS